MTEFSAEHIAITVKWDARCPKIEELDRWELIHFLKIGFTSDEQFEREFCMSLVDQLSRRGSRISRKQFHVIKRMLPDLWDNDPALWRPIDEHDFNPDPDPDFVADYEQMEGENDCDTSGG